MSTFYIIFPPLKIFSSSINWMSYEMLHRGLHSCYSSRSSTMCVCHGFYMYIYVHVCVCGDYYIGTHLTLKKVKKIWCVPFGTQQATHEKKSTRKRFESYSETLSLFWRVKTIEIIIEIFLIPRGYKDKHFSHTQQKSCRTTVSSWPGHLKRNSVKLDPNFLLDWGKIKRI